MRALVIFDIFILLLYQSQNRRAKDGKLSRSLALIMYSSTIFLFGLALMATCSSALRAERFNIASVGRSVRASRESQARGTSWRLSAKKFDPATFVEAIINKPLGIDLVEVEVDAPRGVMIGDLNPEGNAKKSGVIAKGLFLVAVNGIDTKYKTFDEILDVIGGADETVQLTCVAPNDVFKGKAVLSVTTQEGQTFDIECLKGQMMRDVLLGAGVEVYQGAEKLTNCGGGVSCGKCVVNVTDDEDWEARTQAEDKRLKKFPATARLSCNTPVEGDCVVECKPAKIA